MLESLAIRLRGFYKPRLSILGARYSPGQWYRNRNADVFIVWFPKTGGTWARLLLNTALAGHTGIQPRKPLELGEFAAANAAVPLIRALHEDEPHWKRPHQLSENKDRFKDRRIILLVRDPRDTIVSLHLQMTKRWRVTQKDLSEFLWQPRGSFESMIRYYNIWARNRHVPRDLMLVRYEDLQEDCQGTLRSMLDFIGVGDVANEVVDEAVSLNSIDKLRQRETAGVYTTRRLQPGISGDPDSYKARRGKVGGYVDYLSSFEIARTTEIINTQLDPWYGYSSDRGAIGGSAPDDGTDYGLRTRSKTKPIAVNTTDLKRRVTPMPTPIAAEYPTNSVNRT